MTRAIGRLPRGGRAPMGAFSAPAIARFVVEDREHAGPLTYPAGYATADLNAKAEQLLIHVNTAHHR